MCLLTEKKDFIETILVVTIQIVTVLWVLVQCPLYPVTYGLHMRTVCQPQSGSGACTRSRVSGYCWRFSTRSMMNDSEEYLDDFPTENREKPAESMVGACRAESTDLFTAGSGITAKIPPLFDGSASWFRYEELIDDWLDLTLIEAEERGSAPKNRLVGDAALYKGLLNRESLTAADGVKFFRGRLRPHFIKGAQSVFLWRFYQFTRARRGHVEMVKWIGKFSLLLKRLKDSWMDMLPVRPERTAKNKSVSCRHGSRECW